MTTQNVALSFPLLLGYKLLTSDTPRTSQLMVPSLHNTSCERRRSTGYLNKLSPLNNRGLWLETPSPLLQKHAGLMVYCGIAVFPKPYFVMCSFNSELFCNVVQWFSCCKNCPYHLFSCDVIMWYCSVVLLLLNINSWLYTCIYWFLLPELYALHFSSIQFFTILFHLYYWLLVLNYYGVSVLPIKWIFCINCKLTGPKK